jgi:hypothetical protein
MMAGVIYRKDSQCCGTCVYWRGMREATMSCGVIVDTTIIGRCDHPNNFPITERWATENPCPKYVLYPAIDY